jgi:hypothetical protein
MNSVHDVLVMRSYICLSSRSKSVLLAECVGMLLHPVPEALSCPWNCVTVERLRDE